MTDEKPIPDYPAFGLPDAKDGGFVDKTGDPKKHGFVDENGDPLTELRMDKRINIFVGANNTGKSRLLRLVTVSNELRTPENCPEARQFLELVESATSRLNKTSSAITEDLLPYYDSDSEEYALDGKTEEIRLIHKLLTYIIELAGGIETPNAGGYTLFVNKNLKSARAAIAKMEKEGAWMSSHLTHETKSFTSARYIVKKVLPKITQAIENIERPMCYLSRIYIPVLRGLRPLGKVERGNSRAVRTHDDFELDEKINIHTGESLYDNVLELKKTQSGEQEHEEFERFLSANFFNGKTVRIHPEDQKDVVHISIDGGTSRPIYDVGDGIQALIILTYPIFTAEPSWICIEEPELFLHPGYQRLLLQVMKKHDRHRYFMTTHSNHFLDMTMSEDDVAVFCFSPTKDAETGEPRFQVCHTSPTDRTALELLGVQNSSVYLVNATLWVEGITDRLYFREYLRLHQKAHPELAQLHEDLHYAFIEYGGANIVHYAFGSEEGEGIATEPICGKSMVIVDADDGKNKEGCGSFGTTAVLYEIGGLG